MVKLGCLAFACFVLWSSLVVASPKEKRNSLCDGDPSEILEEICRQHEEFKKHHEEEVNQVLACLKRDIADFVNPCDADNLPAENENAKKALCSMKAHEEEIYGCVMEVFAPMIEEVSPANMTTMEVERKRRKKRSGEGENDDSSSESVDDETSDPESVGEEKACRWEEMDVAIEELCALDYANKTDLVV